jgi:hypothetical protein
MQGCILWCLSHENKSLKKHNGQGKAWLPLLPSFSSKKNQ